jgi:hypothetical protein
MVWSAEMAEQTPPARIIKASQYRDGVYVDEIDIVGYTKHGSTLLLGFDPLAKVAVRDVFKTKIWILSAKDFQVLKEHDRPMKLAGKWYQVKLLPHVKS